MIRLDRLYELESGFDRFCNGMDDRMTDFEKRLSADEKRIAQLMERVMELENIMAPPTQAVLSPPADPSVCNEGSTSARKFVDRPDWAVIPIVDQFKPPSAERDLHAESRAWLVKIQRQMTDGGWPDEKTIREVEEWLSTVPDLSVVPMVLRKLRQLTTKEKQDGKSNE